MVKINLSSVVLCLVALLVGCTTNDIPIDPAEGTLVESATLKVNKTTYLTGDSLELDITFTNIVEVSGTPNIDISVGPRTTGSLIYSFGSGTKTLTFSYEVTNLSHTKSLQLSNTNWTAVGGSLNDITTLDLTIVQKLLSQVRINPDLLQTLSGNASHVCAILDNSSVKCWGNNSFGQLGQGDTDHRGDASGELGDALPTINLGTGRTAISITTGEDHTCALLDDASVKCWGVNSGGQLGLGDTNRRGDEPNEMGDFLPAIDLGTGRSAISINAGKYFTCALLDNASVKCWGSNGSGQLGLGNTTTRGDGTGEMGDALPTINLGTGRTAISITTGDFHTCAILDDSSVKCWGHNTSGQLGLENNSHRGDGGGEMGDALPTVNLGTGRTVVSLNAGTGHTCALLDDTTTKCWGNNDLGRLGLGDLNNRGDQNDEMGDALPTINLGTGRTTVAISTGDSHTCTILDSATAKCWGWNAYGQLGLGDSMSRGDGGGEMGDTLPPISLGTGRTAIDLSAGYLHTCALLDNASVKCWGSNTFGQLGQGDATTRGNAGGQMGDALPVISLGTGRTVLTY